MAANGRLAAGDLVIVQRLPTVLLEKHTAAAFVRLKAAAKTKLRRSIRIMPPGGGYRSFGVQDEMYRASRGNIALARKWALNPHSSVPLAPPGNSSHGFGTRVDIVGTPMDAAFLHLAEVFDFTREFGARDPNHFRYLDDGKAGA